MRPSRRWAAQADLQPQSGQLAVSVDPLPRSTPHLPYCPCKPMRVVSAAAERLASPVVSAVAAPERMPQPITMVPVVAGAQWSVSLAQPLSSQAVAGAQGLRTRRHRRAWVAPQVTQFRGPALRLALMDRMGQTPPECPAAGRVASRRPAVMAASTPPRRLTTAPTVAG